MEAAECLKQRDRPQPRGGLRHLHDLADPNRGQRIRPRRPRGAARSEGGAEISVDPPASARAEARHWGGGATDVGASECYVEHRLVVGDV